MYSVFTPYYSETVLYSHSELRDENEDGISILFYLQKIFPGICIYSECSLTLFYWLFSFSSLDHDSIFTSLTHDICHAGLKKLLQESFYSNDIGWNQLFLDTGKDSWAQMLIKDYLSSSFEVQKQMFTLQG